MHLPRVLAFAGLVAALPAPEPQLIADNLSAGPSSSEVQIVAISFSGTGANTTFTGTVGITSTGAEIDAAPFSGTTGALSGTYTLAGEGAQGGTLRLYPDVYHRQTNTIDRVREELQSVGVDGSKLDDGILRQMLSRVNMNEQFVVSVGNL